MSQYQAVNLFVERARAVNPDFVLTNENAPAVAELCTRLDGVPLAIELVAAQIELLTPKELLARLDRGLSALTAGGRDLPERQQSLQRAIDWSYDLLGEAEKRLFRRVSVFAGGCTLKTAQAVVSERSSLTTDDWLPATDMLGGMLSLVGNSLLGQGKQADGSVRFVMLKTIRNYALERLVESGEAETIRRQHALFFLELAEESELNLRGAAQSMWLDRLETEHDNLRAALTWAIESGDVQTSLQLAGTLFPFWYTRGYLSEGRRWLEVVLVRFQALEPTQALAKALNGAGFLAWSQGDYAASRVLFEHGLAIWRELGDRRGIATMLNNLGLVVSAQGDYTVARVLFEESLAIKRELEDNQGLAISLNSLGQVASIEGDYTRARVLFEASLAIVRELWDKRGIADALNNLGFVAERQGHYARAHSLLEESLAISRELADKLGTAHDLEGLARLASAEEQPDRAARLFGAAEALRNAIGAALPPAARAEHERHAAAIRSRLGEESFTIAWAEGRAMTLDQLVTYASQMVVQA